jgi:SynChlorMet cassette protein ScmD
VPPEKPIANPFVVLREEFDDWAILFDPDTSQTGGLSPTGVWVWKRLDGEHSIDDLVKALRRHADSVPEDVSDHISAFVDHLVALGLVGFERAKFDVVSGPEKSSCSLHEALCEVQPLSYDPPQLVNLSGDRAAYGANCSATGSQATNTCGTGNLACSCSSGTGRSPICCTGACDDACGCGTCVGYCNSGSNGGRWCYGGWPQCVGGCDVQMVACSAGN